MNEAELSAQEVLLIKKARAGLPIIKGWWGTVVSHQAGPPLSLTVTMGGSSVQVPGVRYNPSYTPVDGDVVLILEIGDGDWFVNCKRA